MASFLDYLIDIGILVDKQQMPMNNLLFALSDYFKNLSASESFDLSIRIYDQWSRKKQKIKEQKLVCLEQLFTKQLRIAFNKARCAKIRQVQKSCYQSPIRLKSPSSDSSMLLLQGLNETCERLYLEGMAHKIKKEQLSQEKIEKELKQCTFKPLISNDSQMSSQGVFDRLYSTQLVGKSDFSGIKEKIELNQCTFTPQIKKDIVQQPSIGIFDRLYKESAQRSSNKENLHSMKDVKVLEECTFKPDISSKRGRREESREDLFSRLHNESAEKQQLMAFRKLEKDSSEIKGCSFKPQINESTSPSDFPAHERLYMLSSKKKTLPQENQRIQRNLSKENHSQTSLFERMKTYVNKKKSHIQQLDQEVHKEFTFKPKINQRSSNLNNKTTIVNTNTRVHSQTSALSTEKRLNKPSLNSLSTYILNTKKSQPDSDLSQYCETAYFQSEEQKIRSSRIQSHGLHNR